MNLFILTYCDDDGGGWYECTPMGIYSTYEEAVEEKERLLAPCNAYRDKKAKEREEETKMVEDFLRRNKHAITDCKTCQEGQEWRRVPILSEEYTKRISACPMENKLKSVDSLIKKIVEGAYYDWPREGEGGVNEYRKADQHLNREYLTEEIPLLPPQKFDDYPRPFYAESGFQINECPSFLT